MTVPIIPWITAALGVYHRLGRIDILSMAAVYSLAVLVLDVALTKHAMKMTRLRQITGKPSSGKP